MSGISEMPDKSPMRTIRRDLDPVESGDVASPSAEFMRESEVFISEEFGRLAILVGGAALTGAAAYLLWLIAMAL